MDGKLLEKSNKDESYINMEEYRWSSILENSQFEEFLLRLLKEARSE